MLPERDAYVHFVTIESLLGRVLLDHARTNTERERDIETDRQTDRQTETERQRERQRNREREKINTLLHKNKDLNTSRPFYKSVPDYEHSNTQYSNVE